MLGELRVPRAGDPGYLGRKVGNMVLLLLQGCFGDKQRKVGILHSHSLDARIKILADSLPNAISPGAQHVASAHLTDDSSTSECKRTGNNHERRGRRGKMKKKKEGEEGGKWKDSIEVDIEEDQRAERERTRERERQKDRES